MKNLYYVMALILILAWSIGFIGYGIGGMFHILLVLALSLVVMRVILEKKLVRENSGLHN
jgi:O-antigen/teichoic acid export membrane protein